MLPFLTPVFLSCLRRAPVMVPSPRQSHCGLRCKRATGTFALRCGADFPRLNNPPLETAKKGELRFPLLGTSPRLLRWRLSGGGGLRCNAPAAPACMGENWGTVLERRGGLYGRPRARSCARPLAEPVGLRSGAECGMLGKTNRRRNDMSRADELFIENCKEILANGRAQLRARGRP
mgnify:CR=1 FL=1